MRSSSLNYMPALDGARAVAVGMVFAIHAFPDAAFPGGLGVDVFFVISGFLITRILLREHERAGTIRLKPFYLKRLIRLYPALITVTVASLSLWWLLNDSLLKAGAQSVIALTYTSNIWMTVTQGFLGHLSHTWSLAMEEQFYLLWPPLLLLMLNKRMSTRLIVTLLSVAIAASFAGWVLTAEVTPFNPLTKAGGLLLGCLVAFLVARKPWESKGLAYLGVGVFVLAFVAETAGLTTRAWTMPVATIAVAPIILHLAFGQSWMVRAFSTKPLVYLGTISYGLYLWHYPIFAALRFSTDWSVPVVAVVGLVLTLILSALSFRLIEQPALRLKDRIRTRPTLVSG